MSDVAVVAIGRNEGARLEACLESLQECPGPKVYVDSGSSDGSVDMARQKGALALELDMTTPFTAARARNLGIAAVLSDWENIRYVQLVDGDCSIAPGWISAAREFLESHPDVGAVCGRRREKYPDASIYNRLCDWEWDTPVGQALACGGDALVRVDVLRMPGPYDEGVIAAEDDEFCVRARKAGWTIWRLGRQMTLHDAAITRFSQWWKRMVRAGHGFAQVGHMHPEHFVAPRRRMWIWAVFIPVAALATSFLSLAAALAVTSLYAASWARTLLAFRRAGFGARQAAQASALIVLSKFCNLQGYCTYWIRRARNVRATLIEYK